MNRFDPYSPVYQRVIDGVIAALALWLAFEVLFEGRIPASAAVQMWGSCSQCHLGASLQTS